MVFVKKTHHITSKMYFILRKAGLQNKSPLENNLFYLGRCVKFLRTERVYKIISTQVSKCYVEVNSIQQDIDPKSKKYLIQA